MSELLLTRDMHRDYLMHLIEERLRARKILRGDRQRAARKAAATRRERAHG